jgi:S-formylglutathione hydrolase FrmB
MFPISNAREDRFIAGLSMGGYGAMKAGLRRPDQYAAAASFSGALDVLHTYDRQPAQAADLFGTRAETERSAENNLFVAAQELAASAPGQPGPELYMWCGTEDFLYKDNVSFRDHAESLGLPLTYMEGPGDHQWKYWDLCVERLLKWLPLKPALFPQKGGR